MWIPGISSEHSPCHGKTNNDLANQIDYLKDPDVKAKHAKQLDKFKSFG